MNLSLQFKLLINKVSWPLIQGASVCLGWDHGTHRKSVCRHLEVAMYWFLGFFFSVYEIEECKKSRFFLKIFSQFFIHSILWFPSVGHKLQLCGLSPLLLCRRGNAHRVHLVLELHHVYYTRVCHWKNRVWKLPFLLPTSQCIDRKIC